MSEPTLAVEGLTKRFGGLVAVDAVDMRVREGSIHGLIGPNGAGKTTLFHCVSGLLAPTTGRVLLAGRDITRAAPSARAAAGLARTFQTPLLFEDMTVLETVMTGRHLKGTVGFLGAMFSFRAKRREEAAIRAAAEAILDDVDLAEAAHETVRNLPYGLRRIVEIARALAAEPRLLLLDEVTAGLTPTETDAVAALLRRLVAGGLTVVLVEHDMRFVMTLCEHVTVLNFGKRIAEGTPAEITANEEVIMAYLGSPRRARTEEAADG